MQAGTPLADKSADTGRGGNSVTKIAGLAKNGVKLLRQELALAQRETIEKVTPAIRSSAMVVGGGAVAVYGLAYVLQAIVRLLATRMPSWLAYFLSGGALLTGGIVLAGRGSRQLKNLELIPQKTIRSLKEDKEWLLRQIKSRRI